MAYMRMQKVLISPNLIYPDTVGVAEGRGKNYKSIGLCSPQSSAPDMDSSDVHDLTLPRPLWE